MNWLKPLEGGTWWGEAAKSKTNSWSPEKLAAVERQVEERRAKARALLKKYNSHTKVAKVMGVSQSTVTRWLQERENKSG